MAQSKDDREKQGRKRQAKISPEVREVLQMLNSLEAELETQQPPAR